MLDKRIKKQCHEVGGDEDAKHTPSAKSKRKRFASCVKLSKINKQTSG